MILFFDTETTGFFQDRLPVDHPDQPYIVQLAAQLCEDDGEPVAGFSFIVDPGIGAVSIPERAAAVHGITDEIAVRLGMSAEFALSAFTHLYQRSDLVCAPIINFPPTEKMKAVGFDKPKPPKLEECIRHFFNEDFAGAHDAMADVTACRRVFLHLKSLEVAS